MTLVAQIDGSWLIVSGDAAVDTDRYPHVDIVRQLYDIEVEDNDSIGTLIPISGAVDSSVVNIDARGLTNAGTRIFSASSGDVMIRGSHQDDHITRFSGSGGNDRIYGQGGDDNISSGGGNDRVHAGTGDDEVDAGEGNDTIIGHRGDDIIDGGAGTDTLIFHGNMSEYDLSEVAGRYVISHLGGTGFDGTDTFANVEFLQFADQTIEPDVWFLV